MSIEDYRINAFVRSVLVKRWIDTSKVQIETVNSVVYLNGSLCQTYRDGRNEPWDKTKAMLALVRKVERDISAIEGVKDVVFSLTNFKKRAGRWRIVARM